MEHCLTQLVKQGRPFKYIGDSTPHLLENNNNNVALHIGMDHVFLMFVYQCFAVNCTIMQKSGAGLHTANSCYWDTNTDGEKGFLQCIFP